VRDAVAEVVGREPVEAGVAFWMDAAVFAQAGIPTVNYGPTGEGAHAAVEWVDLASVVTCARVLVNAARRFTASPP
jgi:acetylornithine deacetylase